MNMDLGKQVLVADSAFGQTSINGDGSVITFINMSAEDSGDLYAATLTSNNYTNLQKIPRAPLHYKPVEIDPRFLRTVKLNPAEAESGLVPVTLEMSGIKDAGSMDLDIRYDPEVLTFKGVTPGSLAKNAMLESNSPSPGVVKIGIVDGNGISGNGSIATLQYDVKENAPNTQSILRLERATIADKAGKPLEVTTLNGMFQARSTRGDLNHNGRTDSADALMALKMSVDKLTPDLKGDMNGDGKITAVDARMILESSSSSSTPGIAGPSRAGNSMVSVVKTEK